jgi:hypothetical protein
MVPSLHSFCLTERLEFGAFQRAREKFWRFLSDDASSVPWVEVREDVLNATPDSEDFSSLEASFALNAALVAASIASFLADEGDSHVAEAIGYARDSLHANALSEIGAVVYDSAFETNIETHPLIQRERRVEKEDVAFLAALDEPLRSARILPLIQHRAETQRGLLSKT